MNTISIGCLGTEGEGSNGFSGSGLSFEGEVFDITIDDVVSVPGKFVSVPSQVVPEPGTLLLFGFGLAGLFSFRKRLFPVA